LTNPLSIRQADRQVGGSSFKSYLGKTLPSLLVSTETETGTVTGTVQKSPAGFPAGAANSMFL